MSQSLYQLQLKRDSLAMETYYQEKREFFSDEAACEYGLMWKSELADNPTRDIMVISSLKTGEDIYHDELSGSVYSVSLYSENATTQDIKIYAHSGLIAIYEAMRERNIARCQFATYTIGTMQRGYSHLFIEDTTFLYEYIGTAYTGY